MKYSLVGVDGNSFSIMGKVRRWMRDEGLGKEEIDNYTKDATSGDYNHLLVVSIEMVDFLNEKYEEYDELY